MIDTASAVETPAVETSTAVETPAAGGGTDDFAVVAENEGSTDEPTEGKETETHNADGTEKTPEEQEKFKADASAKATGGKDQVPQEVRGALKTLKDSAPDDPKIQAAVKTLHGAYERWTAAKELLGAGVEGGVVGLRNFLSEVGVKTLPEARAAFRQHGEMVSSVTATDELLHRADPVLAENVFEDMKATGSEKNYGKVVGNFVNHLKTADPTSYYENVAKPMTLAGLDEVEFPAAINSLHKALIAGDNATAMSITKAIAGFYTNLRDELGEAAKISKERAAWEEEKAAGTKAEQAKATKEFETSVATSAEQYNNQRLGKSLGGFLKLPFFKDFPYETKVDLGNGIKANLYDRLRADKDYQSAMAAFWKAKPTAENREKMVAYHQQKIDAIADEVVRTTIQKRYPGYAKGGSAAGKAAAASASKANATKAAAQSVTTGKPIYVASRPENLIRTDIKIAGRSYTANDLQTLQIAGKGFVKTTDGKSVKFVTWRKG